jgi:hypothetical protein
MTVGRGSSFEETGFSPRRAAVQERRKVARTEFREPLPAAQQGDKRIAARLPGIDWDLPGMSKVARFDPHTAAVLAGGGAKRRPCGKPEP